MAALLDHLGDEFGTGRLFRPYRDVRFSSDKSPYKDHQGGYVEVGPSCGYYVQVSSGGLMMAGGWYSSTPQQVARYRDLVSGPRGDELAAILASLGGAGAAIGGEVLRTRPRGVPADHPRLELLRHRTLTAEESHDHVTPWLGTPAVAEEVRAAWRRMRPLVDWLADEVTGRSQE
jgi:uncharacterized protein (TIGR02453 family)